MTDNGRSGPEIKGTEEEKDNMPFDFGAAEVQFDSCELGLVATERLFVSTSRSTDPSYDVGDNTDRKFRWAGQPNEYV